MSEEAQPNDEWGSLAEEVLAEHWAVRTPPTAVSVGVNRRVWQIKDSFLVSCWSDDQPGVQRELELCRSLAASPQVTFEVPAPIPTLDGHSLLKLDSRLWWRTAALSGSHPVPTEPEHVLAVARDLARIHSELAASGVSATVQEVQFHEWPGRALAFIADHPDTLPPPDRDVIKRAAATAERIQDLVAERQLVHGDPSFPNLLCAESEAGLRIDGVLDWQEAAIDSPLTDLSVLGATVWFRSQAEDPTDLLRQALHAYEEAGGRAWPYRSVLLATLTAKLQSVAHHGNRYVQGKGPASLLTEQPRLLESILDELKTD